MFKINHGDRIAQGVIASVMGNNLINLTNIDELSDDTLRGSDGLGSTGVK
jgi:dUTPase